MKSAFIVFDNGEGYGNEKVHSCHSGLSETYNGFIKSGKVYLKDKEGNFYLPERNELFLWDCENGLIEVKIGRKWGYADIHTGEIVIPPQWDWVRPFYGGYAHVANRYRGGRRSRTHEHGVINTKGKCVIPLEYADCSRITIWLKHGERKETFFIMKKGNLYGIVNEKNEIVIPFEYTKIKYVEDIEIGYDSYSKNLICKKGRKYGVIDFDSNIIVPFEYTIYDHDTKNGKHRFGVMKKGKKKLLKPEFRLLRAIFDRRLPPTEADYTYFAENWTAFYDKDFNKIEKLDA